MENEVTKKTNDGAPPTGIDPFPDNCLKNIIAQTASQRVSEGELRSFVKRKVIDSWEQLIYWQSVYLEEVRKGGGTMGHKVGSLRNQQVGLKELFEIL